MLPLLILLCYAANFEALATVRLRCGEATVESRLALGG